MLIAVTILVQYTECVAASGDVTYRTCMFDIATLTFMDGWMDRQKDRRTDRPCIRNICIDRQTSR